MTKTEFLQIRLAPRDRDRVFLAASANHLEPSTWARQVILRALDRWEGTTKSSEVVSETNDTSSGE